MQARHLIATCLLVVASAPVLLPERSANAVVQNACEKKCDEEYEKDSVECTKFKDDEKGKKKCDDAAHEKYKQCREPCTKKSDDLDRCKDKCDEKAAEEHKLCDSVEDKKQKAKCRQAAEEHRAACYKGCEDKYK